MRDEFLNGQQFQNLLKARVLPEDWRVDYKLEPPHSAHGWISPIQFVEACYTDSSYSSHSGWTNNRGPVSIGAA